MHMGGVKDFEHIVWIDIKSLILFLFLLFSHVILLQQNTPMKIAISWGQTPNKITRLVTNEFWLSMQNRKNGKLQ